jgi:methylglyoxal synthase
VHNVPLATNVATADSIIAAIALRGYPEQALSGAL